jgi:hypothetical protein
MKAKDKKALIARLAALPPGDYKLEQMIQHLLGYRTEGSIELAMFLKENVGQRPGTNKKLLLARSSNARFYRIEAALPLITISISGATGVGKSVLAHRIGMFLQGNEVAHKVTIRDGAFELHAEPPSDERAWVTNESPREIVITTEAEGYES